jgi:eukaryotic translation initiation factor 2-alpha kinase 4
MNYSFSTSSERIAVIEDLRKPPIYFPHDWDPLRTQQQESEYGVLDVGSFH